MYIFVTGIVVRVGVGWLLVVPVTTGVVTDGPMATDDWETATRAIASSIHNITHKHSRHVLWDDSSIQYTQCII